MMAPRAASSHIIRWRRSSRSMITPVKGNSSSEGSVCRAISAPSETSECVACRMYQITAAEFMPLPIMETRLAVKISRIPRCCHISRMLFQL